MYCYKKEYYPNVYYIYVLHSILFTFVYTICIYQCMYA